MGDRRRFDILARWLLDNFPPHRYPRVADVAGGRGYLSLALSELGYRATVIDPRKTNLGRSDIKRRRGNLFDRQVRPYKAIYADHYDVVVGLHPDEATEELVASAIVRPAVIVPCCNYWRGPEAHGTSSVAEMCRRWWRRHAIAWRETRLQMSGKNLLLWAG